MHTALHHHAGRMPRCRRAFTLVEAITAMTILATIAALSAPLILQAADGYANAAAAGQLHVEASIALDRLARSLRSVEQDPASPSAAPWISSVSATSVAWDAASSVSRIGDQLVLVHEGSAPAVLLDDVSSFEVRTYDESNTPLPMTMTGASCRAIRRVELGVAMSRYGVVHTLRTRVFVRAAAEGGGS